MRSQRATGLNEERDALVRALATRLQPATLARFVPDRLNIDIPDIERRDGLKARPLQSADELAGIIVDLYGNELLRNRALREALLDAANDEVLEQLLTASGYRARGRKDAIQKISGCKWTPGKRWARAFVRHLGLPLVLSGSSDGGRQASTEIVEPYTPLKPLHFFQDVLRGQMLDILDAGSGKNRAILSLPTGAGKTRTAVEALVRYLRMRTDTASILWIAQNEELCEQAIIAFREVWTEHLIDEARTQYLSLPRSLQLFRFFDNHNHALPELTAGSVVVANIQKLRRLEPTQFKGLLAEIDVAVIDEAHHAIAPSYKPLFDHLSSDLGRPIIGLTATPFRGSEEECRSLIRRFQSRLLAPAMDDPIGELRALGVLSYIRSEVLPTEISFQLSTPELQHTATFHELSTETLDRIGKSVKRNRLILDRLLRIEEGRPTLFFGCSVAHARTMAMLLRRAGRTAASITNETPTGLRRQWIQEFRAGQIDFLCNVGVLTTGFDAPKVEVVAIARPTGSVLLYEQMVGRGMRGPANGGTDSCLLIDFVDNIASFDQPMSYTRISSMWQQSSRMKDKLM
jgi:DNA repair protein RadD